MSKWGIEERQKALEEMFFQKKEIEMINQLKKSSNKEETKAALKEVSGIEDNQLLEKLVEMGLSPESLACISLIPYVHVAWADKVLDSNERDVILKMWNESSSHNSFNSQESQESLSYQLLKSWLDKGPSTDFDLFATWKEYLTSFAKTINKNDLATLKSEILTKAKKVAEASGGILGLGRISKKEAKALTDLEETFNSLL